MYCCLIVACLLWGTPADAPETPVKTEVDPIVHAAELIKTWLAGDDQNFLKAADDKVRAAFSTADSARTRGHLQTQLGSYAGPDLASPQNHARYDVIDFLLEYEQGTATLQIVIDLEGKISGFRLISIDPNPTYELPSYADSNTFTEVDVTVSAGEFPLAGTLTLPNGNGPHPAIVLVHGSGQADQDSTVGVNKPFKDLAVGLASRGIAVLRYVKRTKAYPNAVKENEWTIEMTTIEDALAAVKLLKEHPKIDAKRVRILGHSLGGMVAPMIAQRDPAIDGIVILGSPSRPLLDVIEQQFAFLAKADGEVKADDRAEMERVSKAFAEIRAGKAASVEGRILGASALYWQMLSKIDAVGEALKIDVPILLMHGGRDYNISEEDHTLWKKRMTGRANVTFKRYDTANHFFIPGEGEPSPDDLQKVGHVAVEVIDDIAQWFSKK